MIKTSLYPKTSRISLNKRTFVITEKLDGSNLTIFKYEDKLYFAQRNNIMEMEDLEGNAKAFYKGLAGWIRDNFDQLNTMLNNSAICGEWIAMGKINYADSDISGRFYMFAKANIELDNNKFNLKNIIYKHDLFKYPFAEQVIPECVGLVPVVVGSVEDVDIPYLDNLYEAYCSTKERDVEGFIVYDPALNGILKYVRMKNGIKSEFLTSHSKQSTKFWLVDTNTGTKYLVLAKTEGDAKNTINRFSNAITINEINVSEAISLAKKYNWHDLVDCLRDARAKPSEIVFDVTAREQLL